jgi:hypothetical protein
MGLVAFRAYWNQRKTLAWLRINYGSITKGSGATKNLRIFEIMQEGLQAHVNQFVCVKSLGCLNANQINPFAQQWNGNGCVRYELGIAFKAS